VWKSGWRTPVLGTPPFAPLLERLSGRVANITLNLPAPNRISGIAPNRLSG